MDRQAVLERTTEKTETQVAEQSVEMSVEEKQHLEQMQEYRKMLYALDTEEVETIEQKTAPAYASAYAPAAAPSEAAKRIADYKSYNYPASKNILFEGITYKNGELITNAPAASAPAYAPAAAPVVAPAPVAAPAPAVAPAAVAAPVAMPAPAAVSAEEDALPTRRTMESIRQTVEETAAAQRTSFFAGVSTKAKVVLAAIVVAIVAAIIVICINTGIINALDADIEILRSEALQEQQIYEDLKQQLDAIENFEGPVSDMVKEFAESHGMIRAD